MTKFELINGHLCRMVEPKPLLADAKVGDLCKRRDGKWVQIVALHNELPYPISCSDGYTRQYNGAVGEYSGLPRDIISTEPLAPEGTVEWAWQMLKLGRTVTNAPHLHYYEHNIDTGVVHCVVISCGARHSEAYIDTWLNGRGNFHTWNLYEEPKPEPKPLLADAKVGDLCQLRNGIYEQIERRESIDCVDYVVLHGCYYDLRGKAMNRACGNIKDIISTEPLAPIGTAEWAWQMMKLGYKVTKRHLKHTYWHYDASPHLKCISEYNCGILQIMVSPDIWIKTADREGWQIYAEPAKEPEIVAHKQHANCLVCGKEIEGLLDGHATVSIKRYSISSLYESTYSHYCGKCFLELGFDATERELRNRQQPIAEPKQEPQPAKEPIANCDNCKHICANSNIDHCHMYEPQPAYAVGDWVEKQDRYGNIHQDYITASGTELGRDFMTTHKTKTLKYDRHTGLALDGSPRRILRKLDPSEVVVDFGRFKGRVKKYHGDQVRVYDENDINFACVAIAFLDPATRSIVDSLLKAQEEANG